MGTVGSLSYRNITADSCIQKRVELAKRVLDQFAVPQRVLGAQQTSEQFTTWNKNHPAAYFAFGGDIFGMVRILPAKVFFCFDRMAFIDKKTTASLSSLQKTLSQSVRQRNRIGFFHRGYYTKLNEAGLHSIFDVLGMGGNPQIWAAEGTNGVYKIVFDLAGKEYKVFVIEEELRGVRLPISLRDVSLGSVLVKAAGDNSLVYGALDNYVFSLPEGALVISDKEMGNPLLEPIPIIIDDEEAVEATAFKMTPKITPFGYANDRVFMYRVNTVALAKRIAVKK